MPGKRGKLEALAKGLESPFSDFLERNPCRLPSLQETRTINELVAQNKSHLALLNSRVPRKKSGKRMPPALRAEINLTRRFIKFHQALVAPWQRLPDEILSEIFAFTLPSFPDHTKMGLDWIDGRRGTLLLCRICRSWRQIALSTPSLWTILSIHLDLSHSSFEWIPLWLERSRSLPIYLQVIWGGMSSPFRLNSVMSYVVAHLHHIRTLSINGLDEIHLWPAPTYPRAILTPDSVKAPFLTTIEASLPLGSDYDWVFAVCEEAPLLQRLYTNKYFPDRFPSSQLTALHILEGVPINDFLLLLRDVPGLKEVAIDLDGPSAAHPVGGIVVAQGLSKLAITSDQHLGHFLNHVELPGLADLEISQIDRWPEQEFASFLSRSSCVLTRIAFVAVHISCDRIIRCLRHKSCDSLEELAVVESIFNHDALMQHLTYRQAPFPHPRLQTIEFMPPSATDGLLADLVESRTLPVAVLPGNVAEPGRLTRVHFYMTFIKAKTPNDYTRLRKLETNGDIQILEQGLLGL
ncbi:hypothetical protein DFH09DRAFT_540422 [Mycena vulgaris]|nr:hypothetical protein DFH09DRAFT_540422 [Mycena vulgaris]